MKIEIYQVGGFAGDRVKLKELNTENISQEEQEQINQLIIQSGFFQLNQEDLPNTTTGAHMTEYEIGIDDNNNAASLRFVKSGNTKELNGLLEYILSLG